MSDNGGQRRLATIVSIDVAGYSARTEADEEGAASDVLALGARITEACARHGGRVFNTAGDGFMLEFPAVSGALAAAEELAADPLPPIRVGVHLAEVTVTPTGDLLGHGVNVAARIQALAAPGAVLVSGEVQRALRGRQGARLIPQGRAQLDKMGETVQLFRLAAGPGRRSRLKLGRRAGLAALGLALAAAAIVAVVYLRPPHPGGGGAALIVFKPVVAETPALGQAASDIGDAVVRVLSTNGLTPAAKTPGAGDAERTVVVESTIRDSAGLIRVTARVSGGKDQATLWSGQFERPAAETAALPAQVSAKLFDIVNCAALTVKQGTDLTPESRALYLRACDLRRQNGQADQVLELGRKVVRISPAFAPAWGDIAVQAANAMAYVSREQAAALWVEADAAADRVLRLQPTDQAGYLAKSSLVSQNDWAAREAWLLKGLAVRPSSSLMAYEGGVLFEVGRLTDAESFARRSIDTDPNSPPKIAYLAAVLTAKGEVTETRALVQQAQVIAPLNAATRGAAFALVAFDDPAAARAILADGARRPRNFADEGAQAWSALLDARKSPAPAARAQAVRLLTGALSKGSVDANLTLRALLSLGEFKAVEANYRNRIAAGLSNDTTALFTPEAAAFRRDPRFMAVANDLGLVAYWRKSGKWPDFCAEPGLPYDCRAEAARLSKP